MIMKVGWDGASWEKKKGHMEWGGGGTSAVLECSISWTGWCYVGGNPFFKKIYILFILFGCIGS